MIIVKADKPKPRWAIHSISEPDNIAAGLAEREQKVMNRLGARDFLCVNSRHNPTPRIFVPSLQPSNCTPSTSAALEGDLEERRDRAVALRPYLAPLFR
jgi:hypothetical protein